MKKGEREYTIVSVESLRHRQNIKIISFLFSFRFLYDSDRLFVIEIYKMKRIGILNGIGICNFCNKMYKTLDILKNHKAKVHEGVNYPCDRCVYKATRKSNLIRHTRQVTFSKKIMKTDVNLYFYKK